MDVKITGPKGGTIAANAPAAKLSVLIPAYLKRWSSVTIGTVKVAAKVAAKPTSASSKQLIAMKRGGIADPVLVQKVAARVELPLQFACAMLEKETGGGHNEWGHDPTIFVGGFDARNNIHYGPIVTEKAYAAYKAQRGPRGKGGMQGVGHCQLTYYTLQDQADKLGGCWKPEFNMQVGFKLLKDHIQRYGIAAGGAAYNGTGPAAEAYGADFEKKSQRWAALLKTT